MGLPDYAAWIAALLRSMEDLGPESVSALRYIHQRGTRVGVHDQPTGARWTIDRRIDVHPRYVQSAPADAYAVGLIIHEVRHLQQGILTALSVYGELDAWQLQFHFLHSRLGHYHDDPRRDAIIRELMSLPLGWDRTILGSARRLMQDYAGKQYRVDLLPPYPFPREMLFQITRRSPNAGSERGYPS